MRVREGMAPKVYVAGEWRPYRGEVHAQVRRCYPRLWLSLCVGLGLLLISLALSQYVHEAQVCCREAAESQHLENVHERCDQLRFLAE